MPDTPRFVTGYDTDTFIADCRAAYGPETADEIAAVIRRHDALEQAADIVNSNDCDHAFEAIEEEQRAEQAAQELARRIRRNEEIRRRAEEILDEDDDGAGGVEP